MLINIDINARYEFVRLPPTFLCNNFLLSLKNGINEDKKDEETIKKFYGDPWFCRVERHERGFKVVMYNSD